ncbi:hypothetical protein JCM10450v2_005552 [Rhodotorula kratochvilovae]
MGGSTGSATRPPCVSPHSLRGKTADTIPQYLATAALDYTPPGLIAPPPPSSFSFRALRADLERLYILCPPPVWQRLLLGSFASLWRWENPRRTGTWIAVYLVLWLGDLLLLFPFAFLLFHLLQARFFPPSTDELLAQAADRRARSRDAAELGKQLSASSRFGVLGGGVRGLWNEVRDRLGRDDDDSGEEKSLAAAIGSGAALGGIAGGLGGEPLRRNRASSSASTTPETPPPMPPSALARALGSSAGVLSASAAPSQTSLEALRPPPSARLDVRDEGYDPARGPAGEGELSLYRLVRHLAGVFGPQAVLWCGEAADLSEMVKNVINHPEHPASRAVALRLALVCAVLLFTPAWVVYKVLWLWAGTEVFVLWRVRELYPEWRRATLPYWWLLVGAPTDVDYALHLLRQRNLTQRPLRGAKTLRRTSRAAAEPAQQQGKRAAARRAGRALLRRAQGGKEEVLLASGESEAVLGSFFALHSSAPGLLRLSRSTVLFTPYRRLRRLGALAARLTRSSSTSSSSSDDDNDDESLASGATGSTTASGRARGEVQLAVGEIASVRKEMRMGALEGLVVTTSEGKAYRFANVARRDDAFNKLLSLSSARWEAT